MRINKNNYRCPVCDKEFLITHCGNYAYKYKVKRTTVYCCSYKCLNEHRKRGANYEQKKLM